MRVKLTCELGDFYVELADPAHLHILRCDHFELGGFAIRSVWGQARRRADGRWMVYNLEVTGSKIRAGIRGVLRRPNDKCIERLRRHLAGAIAEWYEISGVDLERTLRTRRLKASEWRVKDLLREQGDLEALIEEDRQALAKLDLQPPTSGEVVAGLLLPGSLSE